jgi:hypothetical protein
MHLCMSSSLPDRDLDASLGLNVEKLQSQLPQVTSFMAGYLAARSALKVRSLGAPLPPLKLAHLCSATLLAGTGLSFSGRLALLELPATSLDFDSHRPMLLAGAPSGDLQQQSPHRLVVSTRRRACYFTILARGGLVSGAERVFGPFDSAITLSHKVAVYAYGLKKPRAVNRVAMGLVAKLLRRFLVTLEVRSLSVVLRGLPAGLNFF